MEIVKLDNDYYRIYGWQTPEESDMGWGEMCYAQYRKDICYYPVLAIAKSNHTFEPLHFRLNDPCLQPEYVLEIPYPGTGLGMMGVPPDDIFFKVGDARPDAPKIKQYKLVQDETD